MFAMASVFSWETLLAFALLHSVLQGQICLLLQVFLDFLLNRDHSVVFEIASKYCISDSFVDHDGYSISSEGFLPAVVDIMVI